MSKKDFSKGFDSILESEVLSKKVDKLDKEPEENKVSTSRTTLYLREDLRDAVKDISYWERKTLTSVVNEAFQNYVNNYIEKNGKIEKRPEDSK